MKRTKYAIRNIREGYLLIAPLLAGALLFYAAPFLLVLRNSAFRGISYSEKFVGLDNFWDIPANEVFQLAFGNTLKFLAISIPLMIVISFAIALLLQGQAKKHETLKSVLLLPYIMPVAGTVVLIQVLFAQAGIINQGLYTLGLPMADWLQSEHAFGVVVLLYLWKNMGYSVILLLSGLVTLSPEHDQAAELDGASRWQRLWYITIPQMWYSIFFTTVFSLINAFKCFREIFLVGGTHPDPSIYMLQHFINNAFNNLNYPKLSVASILLLLLLTALFALCYRWVMKKEAYKE